MEHILIYFISNYITNNICYVYIWINNCPKIYKEINNNIVYDCYIDRISNKDNEFPTIIVEFIIFTKLTNNNT